MILHLPDSILYLPHDGGVLQGRILLCLLSQPCLNCSVHVGRPAKSHATLHH
jgi:hypothetical protein